jgi:transposase
MLANTALLNAWRFLVDKLIGIENSMRASLRNFGLKMSQVSRSKWAARARELAAGTPVLELVIEAPLRVRDVLRQELRAIDRKLLDEAKADPIVRMLMTAPGVGAVVADVQKRSRQSGPFQASAGCRSLVGIDGKPIPVWSHRHVGHITKAGDAGVRTALYGAATTLLGRVTGW